MFYYTLNTIKQPPSLKVKTNHPLIYTRHFTGGLPSRWLFHSSLSYPHHPHPPGPFPPYRRQPRAVTRALDPTAHAPAPTADGRPGSPSSGPGRTGPIGRAGPDAPSLKPSQGQYATLYLAPPLHELQLCSALSPGSLARLACAISLFLLAHSRCGARDPRHSAAGNPNPSPRTDAGGCGRARVAPRRRSRSRRRRAEPR